MIASGRAPDNGPGVLAAARGSLERPASHVGSCPHNFLGLVDAAPRRPYLPPTAFGAPPLRSMRQVDQPLDRADLRRIAGASPWIRAFFDMSGDIAGRSRFSCSSSSWRRCRSTGSRSRCPSRSSTTPSRAGPSRTARPSRRCSTSPSTCRNSSAAGIYQLHRGIIARADVLSVRAEPLVPLSGPDQRRLQILHQHPQGPSRRAHAAAHALRPLRAAAALPARGHGHGQARRGGEHDQGRGRADRRVHRRRLHPAGLPGDAGRDRAPLHHRAELLDGARGARHRPRPGDRHPDPAARAAAPRPRAPARLAPARRPHRRGRRDRPPPSTATARRISSRPRSATGSAISISIRADLFRRKFAVKFLNNLLAQVTPFIFYAVGGYFALRGSLDIGQLVAVIAAYRDLPPPIKDLIDWDQQRQDVTIKYEQVAAQFSPPLLLPAHDERTASRCRRATRRSRSSASASRMPRGTASRSACR